MNGGDARGIRCGAGRCGVDTSGVGMSEATRTDSPIEDGVGGQIGGGDGEHMIGGSWKS